LPCNPRKEGLFPSREKGGMVRGCRKRKKIDPWGGKKNGRRRSEQRKRKEGGTDARISRGRNLVEGYEGGEGKGKKILDHLSLLKLYKIPQRERGKGFLFFSCEEKKGKKTPAREKDSYFFYFTREEEEEKGKAILFLLCVRGKKGSTYIIKSHIRKRERKKRGGRLSYEKILFQLKGEEGSF